ncbi:amino acid ABC transporter permease [Streptomyces sp. KL116D]|uniref:amino acid ABC transporter permease n=1 Tax=Streptomyces sp. KL116D TaxID=3045152 RepID=UPI003558FA56
MAWDEWEQLKASHMQMNSLQGEGGYPGTSGEGTGGGGTLKHKGGPWTKAAAAADELQTSTITARVNLRSAHEGVTTGLAGLASATALKSVLTSWNDRLGRVRDECGALEPKLRQVAVDLGEVDAQVGDKSRAVTVPGTRRGE